MYYKIIFLRYTVINNLLQKFMFYFSGVKTHERKSIGTSIAKQTVQFEKKLPQIK